MLHDGHDINYGLGTVCYFISDPPSYKGLVQKVVVCTTPLQPIKHSVCIVLVHVHKCLQVSSKTHPGIHVCSITLKHVHVRVSTYMYMYIHV